VDKLQQRIAWVDALEQQLTRRLSLGAIVNNALNAPQAFIRSWLTRLHLRLRSLSPDRAALPSAGSRGAPCRRIARRSRRPVVGMIQIVTPQSSP